MINLASWVGAPWREPRQNESLMLTLYERPPDWPMFYVIRAYYVGGPKVTASAQVVPFRTEGEAVNWIQTQYPSMTFMGRSADNEPKVLGVWL